MISGYASRNLIQSTCVLRVHGALRRWHLIYRPRARSACAGEGAQLRQGSEVHPRATSGCARLRRTLCIAERGAEEGAST